MKTVKLILCACLCAGATVAMIGCGSTDDGMTKEQTQQGDQLSEIAKRTGGDWDKATEADKKFLMGLSYNNETSAKNLLSMRSRTGPQTANPGGGK